MTTRYPRRTVNTGGPVRRLSPTAVRNTGPLPRFGTLKTDHASNPASGDDPAMPTEINVDAAEPEAGEEAQPLEGDGQEESSETSSQSDGDEQDGLHTVDNLADNVNISSRNDNQLRDESNREMEETLAEARSHLTDAERERVDKRMDKVTSINTQAEYSLAGANDKGKGVDPRNWGDIDLNEIEVNLQTQKELLTEYNERLNRKHRQHTTEFEHNAQDVDPETIDDGGETAHEEEIPDAAGKHEVSRKDVLEYLRNKRKLEREIKKLRQREGTSHRKRKERAGSEPLSGEMAALIQRVAEGSKNKHKYKRADNHNKLKSSKLMATDPITQITSESALGQAFERLGKHQGPRRSDIGDGSSDSSAAGGSDSDSRSGDESSDAESDSTTSGSSSDSSSHHRERHRFRRSKRKSTRHSTIKPTPPEKYDGRVDVRAFHRFLTHGTAYVKYGYVEKKRQVIVLSEFLTGKAYTFYTRRVAFEPEKWSIRKFFVELFNYCFPIDFRSQQRDKLNSLSQGQRSVREYVADLDELFTIVGADSQRARVVKLFNGLRSSLRKALLRAHLNPEYSSWKEIVREAEYQELADNVEFRDLAGQNGNQRSGNQPRNSQQSQNLGMHAGQDKEGKSSQASRRARNFKSGHGKKTNNVPGASSNYNGASGSNGHKWKAKGAKKSDSKQPADQQNAPLSKEEKEEYRAANKCFRCGQEGHFARNCPTKSQARSNSGKPPGISAFGIQVDLDRTEQRRVDSLGETTELSIGMMSINSPDGQGYDSEGDPIPDLQSVTDSDPGWDEQEHTSANMLEEVNDYGDETLLAPPTEFDQKYWMPVDSAEEKLVMLDVDSKRKNLGNAACNKLEEMLESMQPYPGDPANVLQFRGRRFVATPASHNEIMVHDRVFDEFEIINQSKVEQRHFEIGDWYARIRCQRTGAPYTNKTFYQTCLVVDVTAWNAKRVLEAGAPYPYDDDNRTHKYHRFEVILDGDTYLVYDRHLGFRTELSTWRIKNEHLDIVRWYQKQIVRSFEELEKEAYSPPYDPLYDISSLFDEPRDASPEAVDAEYDLDLLRTWLSAAGRLRIEAENGRLRVIELNGQQIPAGTYPSLQRNAACTKDPSRLIPKPLVIVVQVNGHPARALVDSGSLGDFISSTLAQQLNIQKKELASPVPVQLAVQGSRSRINFGATAHLKYQSISEQRYFDVINLSGYDMILGTPFLFQHRVTFGINPPRVIIGSSAPVPLEGSGITQLASRSMKLYEQDLDVIREELRQYAAPICRSASDTPLPPLRVINHTVDLIDPNRIYPWRPSRCPEAMRSQWTEKRDAYLKNGRWKITSRGNTVPMMLIPKPSQPGEPPRLRTVFDLRARNANTIKRSSPLPDIDGILRRVARGKYRSILDGKDAYEQIRIVPEHVERTAVTTPDGNMVSNVVQQGDCNAPATYQALMNHIFSAHIGRFMDVYLDDIIIYSETLREHIEHVKIVIDILRKEKLYLGKDKLKFLCHKMKVLGRVVSDRGISMDPDKVDALARWKTPTNRDLLRGFLGAAGYLADDIDRVRIPMGILHGLTGDTVPFRWEHTHQRAFEDIKRLAVTCREHHRVPLDYSKGAPPINVITDGCGTGIAGVISQGIDWRRAKVAAFYSAKLNSAQQNYPVHEIEMLAGVETMLRYRDILQGVKFTWYTDHKGLIHLLNQKNLSGRQARWMEKLSEFDFNVVYVPGVENILSDSLSRLYSYDEPGTVRARGEYTYHDVINNDSLENHLISMPVLVGTEGESLSLSDTAPASEIDGSSDNHLATNKGIRKSAQAPTEAPKNDRASKNRTYQHGKTPPAETGRAETSREFAARMTKGFVLKGPQQRKEGEGETQKKLTIRIPARQRQGTVDTEQERERELASRSQQLRQTIQDINPVTLTEIMAGGREPTDLLGNIRGRYNEDKTLSIVVEKPRDHKNFEYTEDKLLYLNLNGKRILCIPDIKVNGRNIREIVISEAHTMLAHLGARKTLTYLRDNVWWKSISSDVHAFCESCVICARSKPSNHKPYGMLNPLPVPTQPWEVIGIDFVGPLPESKDRDAVYNSLTVIIDHLTAMIHLVPSRTNYTARNIAELIFAEVYKLHGLPKAIVSDRDSYFTSIFWSHLHELIGTQLKMSSAYHPESDGATERANRTVTQMIRQCVNPNQRDWVAKLPAIEFAINSARSESTGYSPFFLNYGRLPRMMVWDSVQKNEYPGVRVFAQRLKSAIFAAHDSILAARIKQTRNANRKRIPVPFKEGDFVYVSTENMTFPKGLARKLIPKFVGPYLLLKDFGNHSFRVQLPSHMRQRGIHNSFHASLLRIHHPNDDRRFPGRLYSQVAAEIETGLDQEWAADKIINHAGSKITAIFEVLWRAGDKTWLPYDQVRELDILSPYLEALNVENIHELPEGTGTPPMDDPQIFLGSIAPGPINTTPHSLLQHPTPSISQLLEITTQRSQQSTRSMAHRPKNHYTPHPCLTKRPDGFVQLTSVDPNLVVHPAQLIKFLEYDNEVRCRQITANTTEPVGYDSFAAAYNTTKGDNPCEFITRDPATGDWNYDSFPVPRSVLTFPYLDPRYAELRAFGILDDNDDIDTYAWASLKNALLRPHREAVRNQVRSETRRREKEFKKRRMEDARPDGFELPPFLTNDKKKRARNTSPVSHTADPLAALEEMTIDSAFFEAVA